MSLPQDIGGELGRGWGARATGRDAAGTVAAQSLMRLSDHDPLFRRATYRPLIARHLNQKVLQKSYGTGISVRLVGSYAGIFRDDNSKAYCALHSMLVGRYTRECWLVMTVAASRNSTCHGVVVTESDMSGCH